MKKVWRIILIIVAVAIAFSAVCVGVGLITGANMGRIEDGIGQFFAETYNIDYDMLVNEWIPEIFNSVGPGQ